MSASCLSVALLTVVITYATIAAGRENVGCLFSPGVCEEGEEYCFDDYAFGRCTQLGVGGDGDGDELYRFDLQRESLHMLQREMERLFSLGYRWSHLYTQCVLQLMLHSISTNNEYDDDTCSPLADQDLNAALKAIAADDEVPPNLVAHVKFTPSAQDPDSDFADEVYSPLLELLANDREGYPENVIKAQDIDYQTLDGPLRKLLPAKSDRVLKRQHYEDRKTPGVFPIGEFLTEEADERPSHFSQKYSTPDGFRLGVEAKDLAEALASGVVKSFSRTYNTPDTFRLGFETKDINFEEDPREDLVEEVFESPEERQLAYDAYRAAEDPELNEVYGRQTEYLAPVGSIRGEDRLSHDLEVLADGTEGEPQQPGGRVFTEGGVVRIANAPSGETTIPLRDLANGGWGFKRRERLDVKKPGPNFNLNNFAFKNKENKEAPKGDAAPAASADAVAAKTNELPHDSHGSQPVAVPPEPVKIKEKIISLRKKGVGSPQGSPSHRKAATEVEDVVIEFEKPVDWSKAVQIKQEIANLLNIDANALTHTRVEPENALMLFKVDRTDFSATEMESKIEEKRDALEQKINLSIVKIGRQPVALNLSQKNKEYQLWMISFLLCAVIAALAITGAAFFFVRRHSHTKDKLSGLKQPDFEASKDYQELCRARMSGKSGPESALSKITGKDGEPKSPSSRSSTSSWSEEPALTNMDISTGHMVLSYMEDHLKNKDRLEQEWIALCAYEAEPCATTVATLEHNLKKNRYPDVLPYDHSRVLLNQLLNISGSDYVNASTINDHDPRNAAYIATQGPMENTAADLWQMLWEQGSVVMVMLTKLTENGTTMCHRYWPEEGSQVYHIYEVHLVSEHIWCDDYLVRSFYLKNLKTAETRTVTQFHFLSWPENGVPLSTKALLEFRRKVNKSYRGRSCPIVVHCSDGVGRTGTYCLIDMVLNRMAKGAKEIDIAATLEHIRDQRPNMVKTKQQFEFVLMAVAEEVHAILKALPATHSPPPIPKEKE